MLNTQSRSVVLALAILMLGAAATLCRATPRDTLQFTNARLDEIIPVSAYTFVNVTANYSVKYLTLTGTFTVEPGSDQIYSTGLLVTVGSPGGETIQLFPFTVLSPSATTSIAPVLVYRLPHALNSVGTWTATVSYTSIGNRHGLWNTLSVGLNDGPPVVPTNPIAFPAPTQPMSVLGNIGAPGLHVLHQQLPSGGALWYRIDVPVPVTTFSTGFFPFSAYLDIDTEGSAVSASLALFDCDGNLVATDYFSGSLGGGGQAQFSFGTAPTRPGPGNAASDYNNHNGTLPPGVYYIAISRFTAQYAAGWGVSNASTPGGAMSLNIATNIFSSPLCGADFNRSGTLSVQDIFDFLSAWFAGC